MSTKRAPHIDADLKDLEEGNPGIPVYNPRDDRFLRMWVGNDTDGEGGPIGRAYFVLAPDGTAHNPASGREETADGVTVIRDHYEFVRQKVDGKLVRLDQRRMCLSAVKAVRHILKKFGPMGVIWLKGSPEHQEKQKNEARQKHLKWKRAEMQARVNKYNQDLAVWLANPANKGQLQPRAPEDVIGAMEWLADDAEKQRVQRAAFVCEFCHGGYDTNSAAQFEKHMRTFHAAAWAAAQNDTQDDATKERKKPGPKPKSEAATAA